jgi:hypothetical protein
MRKFIILFLFAAISIVGAKAQSTFLAVSPNDVVFDVSGGEEKLTITTNARSWSYFGETGWCLISQFKNTLTIRCYANTGDSERKAELLISAMNKSVTVQITQKTNLHFETFVKEIEPDVPEVVEEIIEYPITYFEEPETIEELDVYEEEKEIIENPVTVLEVSDNVEELVISEVEEQEIIENLTPYFEVENVVEELVISEIEEEVIEIPSIFLELSDTIVEFNVSGGTKTLTVSTNSPAWQLLGQSSWFSKKILDNSIFLDCKANTSTDERNEIFHVSSGDISQKILIKQKALTLLEKGNWKRTLNDVMFNITLRQGNDRYKGEFIQKKEQEGNRIITSNLRHGLGVYLYFEKDSYWGEFRYGDSEGKGIYIIEGNYFFHGCPNCKFYAGNWASDMKNGVGRCYDKTGTLLYYGDYHNDKPTETYPQSNDDTYKFECIEYPNADTYLGETKNGKRAGLGIMIYENGDAWYGEWKDDGKNGKGIDLLFDGSTKAGRWRDGVFFEE